MAFHVSADETPQEPSVTIAAMPHIDHTTLRIHCGLVLAELICLPAFVFELSRALQGNALSWAYVFEWPILGAYAIYMWKKLLLDERGVSSRPEVLVDNEPDPELDAWNEYLAKVHLKEPDTGS